ncbi:hypothetical protein EUX98_g8078 [Antrodiella citrinella]|uniref:CENP-C homolog n=1 Tax=Antrodiella citrinella TaxID=2447956 RepID=A0A4S4MIV1_9APHY|nr:hypothetical protein EUX98_g8078 [Antrodiella citrinella]
MPTSVRKSSIGTTRRGQQAYIPYRGDDFQRGKRTGMPVAVVEHDSSDFEPFEEVLKQADARTPPRPKIQRRKKRGPKTPVVEEPEFDENGEMDMDLVDSTQNSPAMYFSNTRVPAITSSVQRVGSSSRPVHRSSDVDFDDIPSPRRPVPRLSNGRRSLGFGLSPGPSRLSVATNPRDLADGLDVDDNFDVGGYYPPDDDSDNEPMPAPSPSPAPPRRRRSFQQMEEEAEENEEMQVEEEVNENANTPISAKAKGKQRQVAPEEDEEMQDAFDHGGDNGDLEPPDVEDTQEEEEDREATPKLKKGQGKRKVARSENDDESKPKKKRRDGILREVIQDNNQPHPDGLRRGARTRYAPLDWWRLEKVVYGRRESGPCLVPNIKEIHRIPKEEVIPLGIYGKKARKQSRSAKSKTRSVEPELAPDFNPEEGWDDDTQEKGVVLDYEKGIEVEKRIAFTAKMLNLRPAANNDFAFQKIFGDGNFIAAGQLVIPVGRQKPTKGTKDNTFIFYVLEGAVNFKVHRTSFVITTGGMFLVPRGNMYFIQNISDREAKLFFAQARKMPESEEGDEDRSTTSRSPSKDRRSESIKRAPSEAKAGGSKDAKENPSTPLSTSVVSDKNELSITIVAALVASAAGVAGQAALYIPGFDPQPVTADFVGADSDGHTTWRIAPGQPSGSITEDGGVFGTATLIEGPNDAEIILSDPLDGYASESCAIGSDSIANCVLVASQSGVPLNTQTFQDTASPFPVQGGTGSPAPTAGGSPSFPASAPTAPPPRAMGLQAVLPQPRRLALEAPLPLPTPIMVRSEWLLHPSSPE